MKTIIERKTLRGLFIIVLAMTVGILTASFSGGSGSEEDPWHISTASDLDNIRNYPDSSFIQVDDIDLSGWGNWSPIDTFKGSFYGNYFAIENMTINTTDDAGLFGVLDGGALVRVRLEDVDVQGSDYIGALVGINDGGNILFCSSSGEVKGDDNDPYAGGLVGRNEGVITESFSTADVSVGEFSSFSGAGGLVGKNNGTIKDSYALGSALGVYDVAGFVAYNLWNGIIENSYSIGSVGTYGGVTVREVPDRNDPGCHATGRSLYIGGFTGYCAGDVTNSYWDKEASGQDESWSGEGRTTAEMTYPYDANTYENWCFHYRWVADNFNGYLHDGYPFSMRGPCPEITPHPLFSGGEGEPNDPWLIENAFQLSRVRGFLNNHFKLINHIDLSNWNQNGGWEPIGMYNSPFQGSFDGSAPMGGEFTISNLYIDRPGEFDIGLFGFIVHYQDEEWGLSNIALHVDRIKGKAYIGSLAGRIYTLYPYYVENCYVYGIEQGITGFGYEDPEGIWSGAAVGGLIGYSGAVVKSCYVNITATITSYHLYLGGLIGIQGWGRPVTESYTQTSGNGRLMGREEASRIGGLIGEAAGPDISNSYSVSEIHIYGSNVDPDEIEVGGFIGFAYGVSVEDCYSAGEVLLQGNYVGGFIGRFSDNLPFNFTNCFWDRDRSGQATSAGDGNVMGHTTERMLQHETFTGWDFYETWSNWSLEYGNPYTLKTYPHLQHQGEPGEYNYPHGIGTHYKHYLTDNGNRRVHWESFPRLEPAVDSLQYARDLLTPLLDSENGFERIVENLGWYHNEMSYNYYPGEWVGEVLLNRIDGYKIEFLQPVARDLHKISGDLVSADTLLFLEPDVTNWVGYFLHDTQNLLSAIDEHEHLIHSIRGQNGGMYWIEDFGWIGTEESAYFGKMYKIVLRVDYPIVFHWSQPNRGSQRSTPSSAPFYRPVVEHYSYNDHSSYEEFFFEEIAGDEGLKEIAAFVGETCVGAAVFEGNYPVRLLAYTNESHLNDEITFRLYYGDEREVNVTTVEALDNSTGEYSSRVIRPLRQRYTLLRITGEDDDKRRGKPVEPQIVLGQNYPNPVVLGTAGKPAKGSQYRSAPGSTNIPLYLPEEMDITISVFNIRGQKIDTVVSGKFSSGNHTFNWDGRDSRGRTAAAGIYFYRLESEDKTVNKKMLLIR